MFLSSFRRPATSGSVNVTAEINLGANLWITIEAEVEYTISEYVPARTYGPPEDCSPEEGGECELTIYPTEAKLVIDLPDYGGHATTEHVYWSTKFCRDSWRPGEQGRWAELVEKELGYDYLDGLCREYAQRSLEDSRDRSED